LLLAIAAAQLIRSSYTTKPLAPAVFAGVIGLLFGGSDYGVPATGVARLARTEKTISFLAFKFCYPSRSRYSC
jgi:hypothetical protein